MKPIWKGYLQLGVVKVPVKAYTATVSRTLSFNTLHNLCQSRILYEKKCPVHGPVPNQEIVKAYAYEDNKYVVLTPEDFEKIQLESLQSITIKQFVDQNLVDPIYFHGSYYLVPDGLMAGEGYVVLRESMKRTGKMGLAKVVMRGKEYLVALWAKDSAIVMSSLYYEDEIKNPSSLDELNVSVPAKRSKVRLAMRLIDSYTTKFKPKDFQDEFRVQLLEIIKAKVEGREPFTAFEIEAGESEAGHIEKEMPLMEALQQSLSQSKKAQRFQKKEMAKAEPLPAKIKRKIA